MRKRGYPIVRYCIAGSLGAERVIRGRPAETLLELHKRGEKGVVAFDFKGGPAYRLASYVHLLKKANLDIVKRSERHDCGQHARYYLKSPVSILSADWHPNT